MIRVTFSISIGRYTEMCRLLPYPVGLCPSRLLSYGLLSYGLLSGYLAASPSYGKTCVMDLGHYASERTCDTERHAVAWRVFVERDDETSGGEERRKNVSHDVDFGQFLALAFLPDDGVLEHVERLRVELAVQFNRPTGMQHEHLTLRPHC